MGSQKYVENDQDQGNTLIQREVEKMGIVYLGKGMNKRGHDKSMYNHEWSRESRLGCLSSLSDNTRTCGLSIKLKGGKLKCNTKEILYIT